MNYYSLLSFFASIFYIWLGVTVYRENKNGILNRIFLLLNISLVLWALANTFIYPETDRNNLDFLERIAALGWCLFPSFAFHFALRFTKTISDNKFHLIYIFNYTPPVIFIILAMAGIILPTDYIQIRGNTYEIRDNKNLWGLLFLIYNFSYLLLTMIITLIWHNKRISYVEKKQAFLILGTCGIGFFLASLTDVIFPVLNIYIVPHIAPVFGLIWMIGMAHSIHFYQLMVPTPAVAIDEILSHINDYIFMTDSDLNIILLNSAAKNILNITEKKASALNIVNIFQENIENEILLKMNQFWDFHIIKPDKELIPVNLYSSILTNKEGIKMGHIFVCQDLRFIKRMENEINRRIQIEDDLNKSKEELEIKVQERTKELESYATTDTMTGVYNRRIGLILLEQEIIRSKRISTPFTICFIDLNNLKWVNDNFGHHEGDAYILKIVRFFKENLRESDAICRMGGDEFLVILPGSSLEQCGYVCRVIENTLQDYNLTHMPPYHLSFSYGLAEFDPNNPLTVDELIRIADIEMYRNKKLKKEENNTALK